MNEAINYMDNNEKDLSIDELFNDIALTVVCLKENADVGQGNDLHQRCLEQIDFLSQQLQTRQYSQMIIDEIRYASCALLDETVLLRGHNTGTDLWQGQPLQVTLFNTHQAGSEIFERIKQTLSQPSPIPLILACYQRILMLGFQGKYRGKPQQEREQLIAELDRALLKTAAGPSTIFTYPISHGQYFWRNKSVFFWLGTSIALLIAVYLLLERYLDTILKQLLV